MKTSVSVQLGQQLHLTPQLLQSIRLLQLDAQQLQMEVARALEQNPMLELDEEAAAAAGDANDPAATAALDHASVETAAFDELPESSMWDVAGASWSGEGEDRMHRIAEPGSSDPCVRALQRLELELDGPQLEIAGFWLEHCDDAGYLDGDHEALLLRACARFDVSAERIEAVRQRLLHGEPAGMAARDLHECLQAQLAALPAPCPGRTLAARILDHCLPALAAHDHAAIARQLQADEGDVAEAVRLVLSLQPRPAQAESESGDAGYIIPDVVVWQADRQWRVALNPATAPKLAVNGSYERALAQAGESEGSTRLRELLQEARWLTRGLSMRYDTLLRTTRVIVERQAAFLERGDEAMAPLTLKEVADEIGMHESTVSRITSGKYVQTPRGTFELKHFFAVRLEGANVSGAAVKAMVRRLIESEPTTRPLADDAIAALLARQGVHIARRTVAKYREQMSIAPARERRRGAAPLLARAG